MTTSPRRLPGLLLCILPVLILALPAHADDLFVGPGQTYATIQEAVDAATSGDNIIVDPGTYIEQVLIDGKDLSITGAGSQLTVVEAPEALQSFYSTDVDHYPVVGVRDASLDLADLGIDGAGAGALHEQFFGLLLRNAGGSATDLVITGIRNDPLDGSPHGVGLALDNDDATARAFAATGCLIEDFQKTAVSAVAVAGTVLDLDLDGCEIVGAGPTSVIAQNGLEVAGPDVTLGLDATTVRDLAYLAGGATATGVLLTQCGGTVTACSFLACQSGLHLNAAAVSASGNQFVVPRPTDFGVGVRIDNADPQLATAHASLGPVPPPSPFRTQFAARDSRATVSASVTGNAIALDPAVDDATGTDGLRAVNSQGSDDLDLVATGNTFTGFEMAIEIVRTPPSPGTWLAAVCDDNTFEACGTGIASNVTEITVAAQLCWWGAVDGPGGEGPGTGSAVIGQVDYDPWVTDLENLFCLPATLELTEIALSDTVVFDYTGGASGRINGYSVDVIWDPAVATATAEDFIRPPSGPFAAASIFLTQDLAPGQVRIDAAIGGADPGIYSGPLFAGVFGLEPAAPHGAVTAVDVAVNSIRDHLNQPLAGLVPAPGSIAVDSRPVFLSVAVTDTTVGSSAWTADGHDLRIDATLIESNLDSLRCDLTAVGGPVLELADATVNGETYTWYHAGTSGTGDGPVTVTVTGVDTQSATASDEGAITADNTPPAGLTGLVVQPGHQKIHLAWAAPEDDGGSPMAGVEFRYTTWGGYPQYTGPLPDPPADVTEGADTGAGLQTGTELSWDVAPRDVYVLAGFVRDLVGNSGPLGESGAATNYWLGDTDADGLVDVGVDVNALGNTYGLADGDANYDPVCDVGPTDTTSPRGIPQPESDGYRIQFEDLMVFALNLGEVDPAQKFAPGEVPDLRWERVGDRSFSLVLAKPCAGLQGLNLQAELPPAVTATIAPGVALASQDAPIFLQDAGGRDLDVGLAAIGAGAAITGRGDLVQVTLSDPVSELAVTVSARDRSNHELLVSVPGGGGTPQELPARHRLDQNYPNPFNPQTTIGFALPVATRVRVAIFTVNGQLVRTLLDRDLEAGEHSVTWYGRDETGRRVATGTYFYQLRAGDFREVRKLTLVK